MVTFHFEIAFCSVSLFSTSLLNLSKFTLDSVKDKTTDSMVKTLFDKIVHFLHTRSFTFLKYTCSPTYFKSCVLLSHLVLPVSLIIVKVDAEDALQTLCKRCAFTVATGLKWSTRQSLCSLFVEVSCLLYVFFIYYVALICTILWLKLMYDLHFKVFIFEKETRTDYFQSYCT